MAVKEDIDWQTEKETVRERVAFLWNSDLLSDVKFVVPVSNGESETKSTKMIPAHKFVLAISSPVFYAMFYGQMADTTDTIELPDCEFESLLELFRCMYSDEVNLTGSNVMRVLYLAKKYMVPSLAAKCTAYLQDNLEASNVFSILPHAQKLEDTVLEDRCWEVIEMHTEESVTSDEFVTLEKSLVESVVKRERLSVKEVELFKAVDRWATKQSERQGMTPDDKGKRKIIGEEVVKAIRFPLMSQKEFISVVPDCNILTTKEIVDMMKHYNNVLTSPLQFSTAPRVYSMTYIACHDCHRFDNFASPKRWWRYSGKPDRICFTVDNGIRLFGVRHFGCEGCSYTVRVELNDTTSDSCLVNQSGSYSSEVKYHDGSEYYGFDVLFERPVRLKRNNCYEIVSLVCGDISWFGQNGKTKVETCGVIFTFSDSEQKGSSNGTNVSRGQFPALLFST